MGDQVKQRKQAKKAVSWVVVGLALAASIGLIARLYWGTPHLVRDLLIGIAVGVAASAIWWAFFSQVAERQLRLLLGEELAEQRAVLDRGINELIEEVEHNTRRWQNERLPRALYGASNGFDLRFNRDLTRDLERSRIYYFSGPTGIYVPARIELRDAEQELSELRLRLIDPRSPVAIERAVEERMRRDENAGRDRREVMSNLLDDLILVHTELWRISRLVGKIRLCYENVPVLNRLELFESCIYDSSIEREGRAAFPTTAKWNQTHSTWAIAEREFTAQNFVSYMITPQTSEVELRTHLSNYDLKPDRAMDEYHEAYDRKYMSRMRNDLDKARAHEDVLDNGAADLDD
jgi:hypothetical protein